MNTIEQQRYYYLYEQHLIILSLQGKRPAPLMPTHGQFAVLVSFLTVRLIRLRWLI